MPYKFPSPCAYPNCPALTRDRYCDKHKTIAGREYNQFSRHPDHNKIYGRRWRKVREAYISKHPLCETCLEAGLLIPADEVHHKRSPFDGGTHAEENLKSLCKPCHTKTRSGD